MSERPRIVWRTRFARSDWVLFGLFVACAAASLAAIASAMRLDESHAAQGRAVHASRTLARELATLASAPGTDFDTLLPVLARAAGGDVQLLVVEQPVAGVQSWAASRRIVAHGVPSLVGGRLDPTRSSERRLLALLERSRARTADGAAHAWEDERVEAAATSPTRPDLAALVVGVTAAPPSSRPWTMALVTFAMLVLFAAGLHDIFPVVGKYLNSLAFLVAVAALTLLAVALAPELWRGSATSTLVRGAEELRLASLARTLVQDVPSEPSRVPTHALPMVAAALLTYLAGLAGLWHRVVAAVRRDLEAWRFAAPALAALVVLVALPVLVVLGLSFFRAALGEASFVFDANWRRLVGPRAFTGLAGAARPLVTTLALASIAVLAQVGPALLFAWSTRRLSLTSRLARSLLALPFALPPFAAAALVLAAPASAGDRELVVVALVLAWSGFPLFALILDGALARVPTSLDDAARVDGVGPLRLFLAIHLPLVGRELRLGAAVSFVVAMHSVTLVRVAGATGGPNELAASRAHAWAFDRFELGLGATWTMLALLLCVLVVLAARRVTR